MCSKCFAQRYPDRHRQQQQIKNLTKTQEQIEATMKRAVRRRELEEMLAKLKRDKAAGLPTPVNIPPSYIMYDDDVMNVIVSNSRDGC